MMMENDMIYVDGIYLEQLANGLEASRANLEGEVQKIYKDLDELKEGWEGESYDMFLKIMNDHKNSLNSVAMAISAFQDYLAKDVIPAANEFQNEVCAALSTGAYVSSNIKNDAIVE